MMKCYGCARVLVSSYARHASNLLAQRCHKTVPIAVSTGLRAARATLLNIMPSPQAPFAAFRPSVAKALNGFSPREPSQGDLQWAYLERAVFPVPELLLLMLRDVMGFPSYGPGEKVRWTTFFSVSGFPYAIELAKFGLKIYYQREGSEMLKRVTGQLSSALGRLEKRLEPLLKQQIELGNVTLANRSSEFEARYRFFREKADVAYRSSKRNPARKAAQKPGDLGAELSERMESFGRAMGKRREGFFFSVAMVDAYFSYLEHRLVLLRAFSGRAISSGGVEAILMMRWSEKLDDILGPQKSDQGVLLGRLRELKERVRNPFAHGGVENDRGSIYCHIPFIGAIPGNMSRSRRSPHFKWIPVEEEDHGSICELFDQVDALLRSSRLEKPALLADGGIDPVWTPNELKLYRKLVRGSHKALAEYVEHWNYERDKHDNMDY